MPVQEQEIKVSDAFSRQSIIFDAIDDGNDILLWMRNRVRTEVARYIKPGANMLELNCGTGIDSVFFAQKGYNVLATDNAMGMLQMLSNKIDRLHLHDKLSIQKCSFNNLEQLGDRKFDYVFSNFGGLNCTDDLKKVLTDINNLLAPGGYFTLVIMPPVCPWELLMFFRGYFKTAFRRLSKKGTIAHVEGVHFKCYYYAPAYVINAVKKNFTLRSLKGLSIVVPPPFIEHFAEKHPRTFAWLERIENRIYDKAPFNRWNDHYMITMQKNA
jgi:ubiquinone/menaquinone biosynthesis C-methylase UbiE